MPQPLMEPPDAMKSTTHLILDQEQQPEWKAPWDRGVNGVKVIRFLTKGVLALCLAGTSVQITPRRASGLVLGDINSGHTWNRWPWKRRDSKVRQSWDPTSLWPSTKPYYLWDLGNLGNFSEVKVFTTSRSVSQSWTQDGELWAES